MRQYIKQQILSKIEANKTYYADNYIAREANAELDTPEAKKNKDAAEFNMAEAMKKIEWLNNLLNKIEKESSE